MSARHGVTESRDPPQVPRRLLIVDDDQLVLEQLGTDLTAAGYEVKRASDGEEALTLLGRQWFPVVVTDSNMPVMNGLQFTQRLRALAVESTYVIMLTASDSGTDYEVGYCAGVDHYISKKLPASVLQGRVQLAFNAIVQRKLPRNRATLDSLITVDLESGSHTPRHLVGRLNAEMQRALRLQQRMAVLCIGVDADSSRAAQKNKTVSMEQMHAVLAAVQGAIRPQTDWVVKLPGGQCGHRLAIVAPEAGVSEAEALEQRIRNAFVIASGDAASLSQPAKLSFGVGVLNGADAATQAAKMTALEMLGVAERSRQGITAPPPAALETVQHSSESDACVASTPAEGKSEPDTEQKPAAEGSAAPAA